MSVQLISTDYPAFWCDLNVNSCSAIYDGGHIFLSGGNQGALTTSQDTTTLNYTDANGNVTQLAGGLVPVPNKSISSIGGNTTPTNVTNGSWSNIVMSGTVGSSYAYGLTNNNYFSVTNSSGKNINVARLDLNMNFNSPTGGIGILYVQPLLNNSPVIGNTATCSTSLPYFSINGLFMLSNWLAGETIAIKLMVSSGSGTIVVSGGAMCIEVLH